MPSEDDGVYYWTAVDPRDTEVVGPFQSVEKAVGSAASGSEDYAPIRAPENLNLEKQLVKNEMYIKVRVLAGCSDDCLPGKVYWL